MAPASDPGKELPTSSFLCRYSNGIACLLIAGALAVRYWPVLTYPVYWDTIFGSFAEAIWLKEHSFDYALLWQQPGYQDYGPAVYLISILPSLYAVLLSATTPTVTFILLRCLNFIGIGIVVVASYRLLSASRQQWHKIVAVIVLAGLVCHPMYSGQIAAINMEIATSVTSFIAGALMIRGRYAWACIAATLAFFVKQAGLVVCMANLAFAILVMVTDSRRRWSVLAAGLIPVVIGLVVLQLAPDLSAGTIGDLPDFGRQLFRIRNFYPDLVFLLGFIAVIMTAKGALVIGRRGNRTRRTVSLLRVLLHRDPVTLYALIYVSGLVMIFVFYMGPLPRYWSWGLPFIYLLFARSLVAWFRPRHAAIAIAVIWLAASIVNTNGALYPDRPLQLGQQLERSNEYLHDIDILMAVSTELENNYYGDAIIAGSPYVQILTSPDFGYVTKPLPHVYTPHTETHRPQANNVVDIPAERRRNLVLVLKGERSLGAHYLDQIKSFEAMGFTCSLEFSIGAPPLITRVYRAVR